MQTTQTMGQERGIATRMASSLGVAIVAAALLQQAHAGITINNAVSATEINPAGGATIAYENPNWSPWFVNYSAESFTAVAKTAMQAKAGVSILNFENANGYGTATQSMNADGTVFTGNYAYTPFSLGNRIDSIALTTGQSMAVDERVFNSATNTLGAANAGGGVFLVGDRAANDTMVSSTQGLIAGPAFDGSVGPGAFLTFANNISSFSVVFNDQEASYGPIVALFDANNTLLAKYQAGIASGNALYFGVDSPNSLIRSVWMGTNGTLKGVVLDDVAFVVVPEPSAACLLGLGGLLACLRHGFGGQGRRTKK